DADGYGLLLGALGVGAIAGALLMPALRRRLSDNWLLAVAAVTYAGAMALLVLVRHPVVALVVLLPAGAAWITVIAGCSAMIQLLLPAWVGGRGVVSVAM